MEMNFDKKGQLYPGTTHSMLLVAMSKAVKKIGLFVKFDS